MQFASPIPWWAVALVAAGIAGIAYLSYRRPLAPISPPARAALVALRVLSLGAIVFFLCRPVLLLPPAADSDIVVPVLVDTSRSMRVADAGNRPRIERAAELVRNELVPALAGRFKPEVFAVGEAAATASADALAPDARHSNLTGAIETIRERYRGQRVAGIVVVSDGGNTGAADTTDRTGPPVFAIGVGSEEGPPDREVAGITAGDPRLDEASVDLRVAVLSHGFGRAPFQLRLLANGRLLETRTVAPQADGSPREEAFVVVPDPSVATVYTVEIPAAGEETVAENNARSALVSPTGRKRRVLALAGAPGFEYSFLARALARDPGLELDSIVRKGQNEGGEDTFLIQAGGGRASALTSGFPATREALYAYDALIVANVEGDFFTRAQLTMAADFVGGRGGGLVVLGGRSFAQRGLLGTPVEQVLPVELNDRRGGLARASLDVEGAGAPNAVLLAGGGELHPIMRIGSTPHDTRKSWAAMPALAASAALGGPRPGAVVLAVTAAPSGAIYPLVAVQRYGRGRSMVFAGEASWRWRMMQPASNRTYEVFWRQAARWLAGPAPDPVTLTVPESAEPGDAIAIALEARDGEFAPAGDAEVTATLSAPGGESRPLPLRRESGPGRFAGAFSAAQPGLYRVQAQARRGAGPLGSADRWFYVGGADREFAAPRLNAGFLRRVATATGGEYVHADEASRIPPLLHAAVPQTLEPERRDLWHEPWAFALVIALLSAEWILRRRWGLR